MLTSALCGYILLFFLSFEKQEHCVTIVRKHEEIKQHVYTNLIGTDYYLLLENGRLVNVDLQVYLSSELNTNYCYYK